jgi:uncharacterized protein
MKPTAFLGGYTELTKEAEQSIITLLCQHIEREYNIKILFCVEAGSRVWRMNSANSDYDVRFVYYYPFKEYLKTSKPKDVIDCSFDKDCNRIKPEGALYDFCGFDIFKFTQMLISSNPTVIEWLKSDILYYGKKPTDFINYAEACFKPKSLYWHYRSMCTQNYEKYIKSGALLTYKKYLYAMRGLFNAKYVSQLHMLPPIDFTQTLFNLNQFEPEDSETRHIIYRLLEIIELKKKGLEKDITENEVKMNTYIEKYLKDKSTEPTEKQATTSIDLNNTILTILEVK